MSDEIKNLEMQVEYLKAVVKAMKKDMEDIREVLKAHGIKATPANVLATQEGNSYVR
jgi:outer membrane murein-binding lipoprotein Lpp